LRGPTVHSLPPVATLKPVRGSLGEGWPGVWQLSVPAGATPPPRVRRRRFRRPGAGGRRADQPEVAHRLSWPSSDSATRHGFDFPNSVTGMATCLEIVWAAAGAPVIRPAVHIISGNITIAVSQRRC